MQYIDKILEKIDKQNIIHLFNEGSTADEIQREMNISKRFIEQTLWEQEIRGMCINAD